jgi:hypothetical protein
MSAELTFPIFKNKRVCCFFVKANRYLLEKYKNKFIHLNSDQMKILILKDLWKAEYLADLVLENNIPNSIRFFEENTMLKFFLRFGN